MVFPFTNLCNPLLNRSFGNKAIDHHFPVLANTMSSAKCLQSTDQTNSIISFDPVRSKNTDVSCPAVYLDVIVGVPVRIIDDDGVGRCKVDAQTTCSGREEEGKLRSAWSC